MSVRSRTIQNVPDKTGKIPGSVTRVYGSVTRVYWNHRLHSYAMISRSNRERTAQRQDTLAHSRESEAQLVIRPQSTAIVPHPHQRTASPGQSWRRLDGFNGYVDAGGARVAKDIGQRFLNGAVDRQIGGLSGLAQRRRDCRFDGDAGMRLPP